MKCENKTPILLVEKPTKEVSDRMRNVRSKDSIIEKMTERLLRQLYLGYEKQPKMLGHPDFIITERKIAIFCDSSFWHGHSAKKQFFKRNRLFWENKIQENKKRDEKTNRTLRKLGWKVLRFWDDDILKRPAFVAKKIQRYVDPFETTLAAVDLFCGAGGLTHGFFLEGIRIIAGYDVDKTCKYAYENNNAAKFKETNVASISGAKIKNSYPEESIKILAGCAPCQPFSPYSHTKKNVSDKWKLLYEFTRIITDAEPDIITMENVPALISYKSGKVFSHFVDNLKAKQYHVWYDIVDCRDYGIPQYRRRLVLLASRLGEIEMIPATHPRGKYKTVEDAIGDLEPLEAGGSTIKDPLHRCRNLTAKNMLRIKATPEGGDWRSWPEDLVLTCHKKESGKSYGNVYGRMRWGEPSPTITTEFIGIGNGRFGHPTQDRAISLREAALLQTFPYYYNFIDPKADFSAQRIAVHIGNAVPVRLGQVIAKSIKQHVGKIYANRKIYT